MTRHKVQEYKKQDKKDVVKTQNLRTITFNLQVTYDTFDPKP